MRIADEEKPAGGGRAKGKKIPLPLRYPCFVRVIELRGMVRDDMGNSSLVAPLRHPPPYIVLVSSPRLVLASRRLLVLAIYRLVSCLVYRLAVASRLRLIVVSIRVVIVSVVISHPRRLI